MCCDILWTLARQPSKRFPLSASGTLEIIEDGAWVHWSHLNEFHLFILLSNKYPHLDICIRAGAYRLKSGSSSIHNKSADSSSPRPPPPCPLLFPPLQHDLPWQLNQEQTPRLNSRRRTRRRRRGILKQPDRLHLSTIQSSFLPPSDTAPPLRKNRWGSL